MDNCCKVSIIMPVYMSEQYIATSIESVLKQTYDNIELLCINDGTRDSAFEICKRYAKEHNNIVLLENPGNKGLEYTRNNGLNNATGKYVLFLDSDDTLSDCAVECVVQYAESNDADIVMFTYSRIVEGKDNPVCVSGLCEGLHTIRDFCTHLLTETSIGAISCVGAKLYNLKFLNDNGVRFDRQYKFNEDIAFFLISLLNAKNICFSNEAFYKYLIRNSNSIMSSYRPKMFDTISKARELIKTLLVKNSCWDDEHKTAYYNEMYGLIINSFINEVKFGSMETLREAIDTARKYDDFEQLVSILSASEEMTLSRRIVLPMIKHRCVLAIYLIVRVWQCRN